MARTPKTPPPPIDVIEAVTVLNTKMNLFMGVGAAVVAAGAFAVWGIMGQLGEINRSLGRTEGAIATQSTTLQGQLQDIAGTLRAIQAGQSQPMPPPAPDERTLLVPSPDQFQGWYGIRAESAEELSKALQSTAPDTGPLWIYLSDPQAAEVIEKYLPQ